MTPTIGSDFTLVRLVVAESVVWGWTEPPPCGQCDSGCMHFNADSVALIGQTRMAIKLTAESFLNVLKRSELIEANRYEKLIGQLETDGVEFTNAQAIAQELVNRKSISQWQAEKLLQGKHKGFFLGKYKLESLRGKGGMSKVYLAEHVLMRRRVALKVLPPQKVEDSSYLGRFHREAQAVAQLDHMNIVRAYDVDQEGDIHFLVMEYVEGSDLQERVHNDGPLSFIDAADYIRQAADGLAHAHEAGMVHRDIKPGNLLVDRHQVVKILDLGLARFFNEGDEESLTVANDEKVLGTADYLAPEQALDSHNVDARADIYSLGCTLYYLLTGHPPYTEGTLAQRLLAHQAKTPPPISKDRPDVPPELEKIFVRMTTKDREQRLQTAELVAEEFTNWLVANGGDDWRVKNPGLGSDVGMTPPPTASPVIAAPVAAPLAAAVVQAAPVVATATPTAAPIVTPTAAPAPPRTNVSAVAGTSAEVSQDSSTQEEDGGLSDFLSNLGGRPPTEVDPPTVKPVETKLAAVAQPVVQPVAAEPVAAAQPETAEKPVLAAQAVAPARPVTAQPVVAAAVTTATAAAVVATPLSDNKRVADKIPSAVPQPSSTRADHGMPDFSNFEPAGESDFPSFESKSNSAPVASIAEPEIAEALPVTESSESEAAFDSSASKTDSDSDSASYSRRKSSKKRGDGRARSKPMDPKKAKILYLSVGAAVILAAVGAFFAMSGDDGENSDDPNSKTNPKSGYTVGKNGRFKSIAEALNLIRSEKGKGEKTVTVLAGSYSEAIAIDNTQGDFPSGVKIIGEPGAKLVAASEPVLVLKALINFEFDGFEISSNGQPHAIRVVGSAVGVRIANLKISGFTEAGILCQGAFAMSEGSELRFEGVTCANGSAKAVGIHFESQADQVRIVDSRFYGPLAAGLHFSSDRYLENVTISGCVMSACDVGIRIAGKGIGVKSIAVTNNTIHQATHGILFDAQPEGGGHSGNLTFARNAFVEVSEETALVKDGYQAGAFNAFLKNCKQNATDKPKLEATELKIFAAAPKLKLEDFVSVTVGGSGFLKPKADSVLVQKIAEEERLKPYIGAIAP
ncbi:MAG: protein kinase [Planctomycetota bacterium]|nr:protein kinase [Planctomycetota bacterium]